MKDDIPELDGLDIETVNTKYVVNVAVGLVHLWSNKKDMGSSHIHSKVHFCGLKCYSIFCGPFLLPIVQCIGQEEFQLPK